MNADQPERPDPALPQEPGIPGSKPPAEVPAPSGPAEPAAPDGSERPAAPEEPDEEGQRALGADEAGAGGGAS